MSNSAHGHSIWSKSSGPISIPKPCSARSLSKKIAVPTAESRGVLTRMLRLHDVAVILGENIDKSEIKNLIKAFNTPYQDGHVKMLVCVEAAFLTACMTEHQLPITHAKGLVDALNQGCRLEMQRPDVSSYSTNEQSNCTLHDKRGTC